MKVSCLEKKLIQINLYLKFNGLLSIPSNHFVKGLNKYWTLQVAYIIFIIALLVAAIDALPHHRQKRQTFTVTSNNINGRNQLNRVTNQIERQFRRQNNQLNRQIDRLQRQQDRAINQAIRNSGGNSISGGSTGGINILRPGINTGGSTTTILRPGIGGNSIRVGSVTGWKNMVYKYLLWTDSKIYIVYRKLKIKKNRIYSCALLILNVSRSRHRILLFYFIFNLQTNFSVSFKLLILIYSKQYHFLRN